MSAAQQVALRFWAKVDKNGPVPVSRPDLGPCWLWTACLGTSGYGRFGVADGDVWWAHRWSYIELVGAIPDGLELDHLCRNRACVRPGHLEPVTRRENQRRGMGFAGVQSRLTHCPHGHPYSGANLYVWRGQRHCLTCRRARGRKAA